MFLLSDLRLILVFATAVGLTGLGFRWLQPWLPGHKIPEKTMHPGLIPGAILFGFGWALCGCCPSIVFVQLGQGCLSGLVTLAGILTGAAVFGWANRNYLHWGSHSCS